MEKVPRQIGLFRILLTVIAAIIMALIFYTLTGASTLNRCQQSRLKERVGKEAGTRGRHPKLPSGVADGVRLLSEQSQRLEWLLKTLVLDKDSLLGPAKDGEALWWTALLMTTIGSEYRPRTPESRVMCLLLTVYSAAVFGYLTATLATFFIGRDAASVGPIPRTAPKAR